jgi:HlyD family secretion protein
MRFWFLQPRSVLQQNGTGVYVMGQDKKPVFKPISIGTIVGEQTEVKSGLTQNEQVLISFPSGMEPKAEVRGPLGDLTRIRPSTAQT